MFLFKKIIGPFFFPLSLFLEIFIIGLFLLWRKRLHYSLPYLKTLRLAMPLPIIACILGWMTTEMGRQPWIVQGQLRTVDAVSSTVTTGQVAATLAILAVIYTGVFVVWLRVVRGIVRRGPAPESEAAVAGAVEYGAASTTTGEALATVAGAGAAGKGVAR